MSEYKRLTEKSIGSFQYCLKNHKPKVGEFNDYNAFFDYSMAIKRLGEIEDKIENGDSISTSNIGDNEIEFFVKHNADVRKETVKEILQEIRGYYPIDKEHCNDSELFILNLCEDIASKYGVDVAE